MSLRFLSSLNSPQLVTATGVAIAAAFPFVPTATLPLGLLQACNVLAFATNVLAVSIPGRIDGDQDVKMRRGDLNPTPPESISLLNTTNSDPRDDRTLFRPAGWAFAIWAPIYLGEGLFCIAQLMEGAAYADSLRLVTAPFVAANLLQSLWCASFRPSYNDGWHKYVSVAMLGGTAVALSQIPTLAVELELHNNSTWLLLLPMVMHFGWATAATLVNLNGSLAMTEEVSDSSMVAAGHASAVLATGIGVTATVFELSSPAYGLTLAWALAAVANGIKTTDGSSSSSSSAGENNNNNNDNDEHAHFSDAMQTGARVQRALCYTGSVLCVSASAFAYFLL
jgi:hypothetical protein